MAKNRSGETPASAKQKRESGLPGGGQGRKDEIGKSGVYPLSNSEGASPDATLHDQASFGQGERGSEGYKDSGGSELFYTDEELKDKKDKQNAGSRTASPGDKKK